MSSSAAATTTTTTSNAAPHRYQKTTFMSPTFCTYCKGFIWGLRNQGYRCPLCHLTVHKKCLAKAEQTSCEGTKELLASLNPKAPLTPIAASFVKVEEDLKTQGCEINLPDLEWDENLPPLGKGASGIVRLGLWLHSLPVAIKSLNNLPEFIDDTMRAEIYKELSVLAQLRHPNIVFFYGYAKKEGTLLLVTEYVQYGDLSSFIFSPDQYPISETHAIKLCLSICAGMIYLHSRNIIHRDIKISNILVQSWDDAQLKVCDFGLSKKITDNSLRMTINVPGTPSYAAPELTTDAYTSKVDVYSFAIVLWEIFSRERAWGTVAKPWLIFQKVAEGERPPLPPRADAPAWVSPLISRCWAPDHASRPTFVELFHELAQHDLTHPLHTNSSFARLHSSSSAVLSTSSSSLSSTPSSSPTLTPTSPSTSSATSSPPSTTATTSTSTSTSQSTSTSTSSSHAPEGTASPKGNHHT
ncbi:serine/threonine protein kinase 2, CTR2 [Pelomyxa schiedti]|nr:serine/threonine protein kinase 2, CTR2 [Pelomyxa schiedti]